MTGNPLFEPFSLGTLSLPNRVVMAPMTRSFCLEGLPGPDVASYYARRAAGGVGLILSEGTVIDRPAARNDPAVPLFHGEASLGGWKNVIDAVHAAGGRMGPQLWHVGSARNPQTSWRAEGPTDSPSGLSSAGRRFGEPMSDAAIADTISAFARAAADAVRLGFDVVELHAAHGYLIDQFFWAATNERSDRYGGAAIAERSRFASDVVRAVRAAIGNAVPIILRISQWKQQDFSARLAFSPDELEAWLGPLHAAGVDAFHCSQRRYWEPEYPEIDGEDGLNLAGWAKKLTGAATITVGSVGLSGEFVAGLGGEKSSPASIERLLDRLDRQEFDLVAVGRALIADPDWTAKIRSGRVEDLRSFSRDDLATLA